MARFLKATGIFIATALCISTGGAQAGDWEDYGYDDASRPPVYDYDYTDHLDYPGYGEYYDDYSRNSRRDVGGALALGVIGGVAIGAIPPRPHALGQVIVQEDPDCYRVWKRVWNVRYGYYQRKRVLFCD